ncbi:sugar nucleotide-binding protein [Mesotoga sp.]|uniref:sugar nucleotide-binding protein n=1 Tax=Mesotoga sp. TaxID=2053577 RepID=UPI00345E4BC5
MITDLKSVRENRSANQSRRIINCAAYNAVDKAEGDLENAFCQRYRPKELLAIAANEIEIPLMHFSTDCCS